MNDREKLDALMAASDARDRAIEAGTDPVDALAEYDETVAAISEDRHRSHVPQRCRQCGGTRDRDRMDVTTSWEFAQTGKRSYVEGRWDQCAGCGSVEEPEAVSG